MKTVKFVGSLVVVLVMVLILGSAVTDLCLSQGLGVTASVVVGSLVGYPVFGIIVGGLYLYFYDRGK